MDRTPLVLFVCLHGSAKSLIAAEHFNRLARSRGSKLRAESVGMEPDDAVPLGVVSGLAGDGIDVFGYVPKQATDERITAAKHVVSFGCDMGDRVGRTERWDDMPMVSDGFAAARDAIVSRVERLLDSLE